LIGLALIGVLAARPALAACGPIPGTYPISAGTRIDIKKKVKVNGNAVPKKKIGPDAVLAVDGTLQAGVAQSLPSLEPPVFPGNGSSTDLNDPGTLSASSAVYYRDVTVPDNGTLTFTGGGPFHIDRLIVGKNATINLAAGTYFINEIQLGKNTVVNVTSEPVLLHVGKSLKADKNVSMNWDNNVTGLQVFLHSSPNQAKLDVEDKFRFTGIVLAPGSGKIEIGKRSKIHGALITGGKVEIKDRTQITYSAADQAAVGATSTCPPTPSLDHFAIVHSGSAVNCAAEPVTVSAHLADHSVDTGYTGTITLATSTGHGDWSLVSGAGTLVNGGGGAGSYAFAAADAGVVVLALKDTFPEVVNIDASDGGIAGSPAEDPDLSFAAAGFRFLADGVPAAIGTQIAGKGSALAPGAQGLELEAINTDTNTGACEAALTGAVSVELAFECLDPAACAGPQVSISGTAIAGNGSGSVTGYTPVSLDFGNAADRTAPFTLSYPDAGAIRLHARYDVPLGSGPASGNLMQGASNPFVVRPFGFDLDFSGDRAANGTAGVSYAADATGSAFEKAGNGFPTTVRAVTWSAADDADADGAPDPGADLTDNTATPGFGQEAVPATVDITHALVEPLGGATGTLAGGAAVGGFSGGVASPTLSWSEVGIIDLTALTANYLGSGQGVLGKALNVGRFYPARFAVADAGFAFRDGPDAAWTCPFTYMDQTFAFATDPTVTVTAVSALGTPTVNYDRADSAGNPFWRLAGLLAGRGYSDNAATTATLDAPALGTVTLSGEGDGDGAGTFTITGEGFSYLRPGVPIPPFPADVTLTIPKADLTDLDGVCYDSSVTICNANDVAGAGMDYSIAGIGATEQRFGRLNLVSAAGSELLALGLPMRAEHYGAAGGFVPNADDSCTAIGTAFIDLVNDQADPPMGTASIAIGGGSSTATVANVPFVNGEGGLSFSAPGAGNTGYSDVTFRLGLGTGAGQPWLQFDWDGDGAHDNDPAARASFGIYEGSRLLIHIREPWDWN